jgi:hypothetical protein
MTESPRRDVTFLLDEWAHGDQAALDELLPLVHTELHKIENVGSISFLSEISVVNVYANLNVRAGLSVFGGSVSSTSYHIARRSPVTRRNSG